MAAIALLTDIPGAVESVFLNNQNELSKVGIYGVNVYALGVPHTIIVDDWMPFMLDDNK